MYDVSAIPRNKWIKSPEWLVIFGPNYKISKKKI